MSQRSIDSTAAELARDRRFGLVLGSAFVLQVMHPVVAGGVADHSAFRADPWGRFIRSWDGLVRLLSAPDRDVQARHLRAAHAGIHGVDASGRRYHAHDDEACWWVLATGVDATLRFARLMGRDASEAFDHRILDAYRKLGLAYGIDAALIPPTPAEFQTWWRRMLAERLENGPMVQTVLDLAQRPPAPPNAPAPLWRPVAPALGHLLRATVIAALPEAARERLGLRLTAPARAEFRALVAVARLAPAPPPSDP